MPLAFFHLQSMSAQVQPDARKGQTKLLRPSFESFRFVVRGSGGGGGDDDDQVAETRWTIGFSYKTERKREMGGG